jgi:hypothetical protein
VRTTPFIERIFQRHFGARAESIVENLAASPQMEAVLAEMDAAQVERRRELVAHLAAAPKRHEGRCAEAAKEAAAAEKAVAAARAALDTAMSRSMRATSAAAGASSSYEHEVGQIERELESTADPRLEVFATSCQSIFHVVRHFKPKEIVQPPGHRPGIVLDGSAITEAMAALTDAAVKARAMKLQALTFAEITTALEALRTPLLPKLSAAGFNGAPATDGSNAQALTVH